MNLVWNETKHAGIPIAIGNDHPISLGWVVKLICDHPLVRADLRATKEQVQHFLNGNTCCGCHATWDTKKLAVLYIGGHEEDGRVVPIGRIVELIVHEVSHLVDGMLERACVKTVDTEVRAYYLDWMVGKILHAFPVLWEQPDIAGRRTSNQR